MAANRRGIRIGSGGRALLWDRGVPETSVDQFISRPWQQRQLQASSVVHGPFGDPGAGLGPRNLYGCSFGDLQAHVVETRLRHCSRSGSAD